MTYIELRDELRKNTFKARRLREMFRLRFKNDKVSHLVFRQIGLAVLWIAAIATIAIAAFALVQWSTG